VSWQPISDPIRCLANEEDLADFETDLAAPVQICRIADALSPGHWRPSRIYAQLMPTSTRGRIPDAHSLGQLAQAAAETARSHLDEAEVLLVHGSWPQARALAVPAFEEAGKAYLWLIALLAPYPLREKFPFRELDWNHQWKLAAAHSPPKITDTVSWRAPGGACQAVVSG